MKTRIVIIGNGQFAANCLGVMTRLDEVEVPLVLFDPDSEAFNGLLEHRCAQQRIPVEGRRRINAPDVLELVREARPDYLFSVYNLRILKSPLLAIPRVGTINFHNGPLPKYRGIHVYSWAIINGEQEYGVCWHWVDEGIDTGDVIGKKMFRLDGDETPMSLSRKGFRVGVELLQEIFDPLIRGELTSVPQDNVEATSYSRHDIPNGGHVDFAWSFTKFERFIRGLNYQPLANPLAYPAAAHNGRLFFPQRVIRLSVSPRYEQPGAIESIHEDRIDVRLGDCVAGLTELLDVNKEPVTPGVLSRDYLMRVGDCLE